MNLCTCMLLFYKSQPSNIMELNKYVKGRKEGRKEGKKEGKMEGRKEGKKERKKERGKEGKKERKKEQWTENERISFAWKLVGEGRR